MKRTINQTGWAVRPIGLGGMPLSITGRPEEGQAIAVIETFVGLGGDFIDTANSIASMTASSAIMSA